MMKLYGHPWSTNTRKSLAVIAEKGHSVPLSLVMIPTGEHKQPAHVARHPFGKVPVLEHDGFVLYETRAITAYLDRVLDGPQLVPDGARERARVDQWISAADAYFIPHAHVVIFEALFRRYLGGEPNAAAIAAARPALEPALDVVERALAAGGPYLAGAAFSIADIHWMPYVEYLVRIGEGAAFEQRRNVWAWWQRVSGRSAWQQVARTGPQPDQAGMTADMVEKMYR